MDTTSWPSLERVILPSRAFLLSWRNQTLPVRSAAIADAVEHFEGLGSDAPTGLRDMALLAVISEAMQPLEDLAYLATAWDEPFGGLANYVRATVYSGWVPSSFWQRIHKRDDEYFEVLAGYRARDPGTGTATDLLSGLGGTAMLTTAQADALDVARAATRKRLRVLLGALAADWAQFGHYFYAYKHGGLTVNRADAAWVNDDVDDVTDATPRRVPSIAVWHRGSKQMEGRADFSLEPQDAARTAAATGRLAIDLVDAFVDSRMALFDAIEFEKDGSVTALRPAQLPWTVWLRAGDLAPEIWQLIGRGPRITWIGERTASDRLPFAQPIDASAAPPDAQDEGVAGGTTSTR